MILLTEYICLSLPVYATPAYNLSKWTHGRVLELKILSLAYKANVFPNSSKREKITCMGMKILHAWEWKDYMSTKYFS